LIVKYISMMIQNINIELDANEFFPKVEITFPDLFDEMERYDNSYDSLTKDLAYTIERLRKIPGVSIKLKSLYDADTEQTT